jgi:hypothetical protein
LPMEELVNFNIQPIKLSFSYLKLVFEMIC